jgi:hypothetical protein
MAVPGTAEVTLEAPPPLDVSLRLLPFEGSGVALVDDAGRRIARGKPATLAIDVPAPPTFAEGEDATSRYIGHHDHPYPTCFVCGPERSAPDALGLRPGPVKGRAIVATPFVPDVSLADADGVVRSEFVWASLDCPSYFGHASFEPVEARILLGRLTATIAERPHAGERCVVIGWSLGRQGRKIRCATALFGENGTSYAQAEAIWIVLPPGT